MTAVTLLQPTCCSRAPASLVEGLALHHAKPRSPFLRRVRLLEVGVKAPQQTESLVIVGGILPALRASGPSRRRAGRADGPAGTAVTLSSLISFLRLAWALCSLLSVRLLPKVQTKPQNVYRRNVPAGSRNRGSTQLMCCR